MKLGIIGLPNSGKTTVFNALTGQAIEAAAYPTPIGEDAHVGIVRVPDARIDRLSEIYNPKKTTFADVTCVDITGFSAGISASKQKAKVFDQAWDVDAFIHVVRGFEDPAVVHADGEIDPVRDAAALDLELVFHDLELVETRLERIANSMKKGIGDGLEPERDILVRFQAQLEEEKPLRNLTISDKEHAVIGSLQFVSLKPELVVLNVGEDGIGSAATDETLTALGAHFEGKDAEVFSLCGKIEMELTQLDPEEALAFLEDLGIGEPAMNLVIRKAYELLGLISFFTSGEDEVKAWTIRNGTHAVKAAGKIHSDIERGFIRAETIGYDDFIAAGSTAKGKELGTLRLEGKDYVVQDGDIVNFRFNV
ncbi:MAG: redox-regulated ATPase YchF [Thermoleophilia bacterium]